MHNSDAVPFAVDEPVRHADHGAGHVVVDLGATVVVRFAGRVEQVLPAELERVPTIEGRLAAGRADDGLEVLARAQALAIRSVNDQWGVFSRSRVALLPHQLWVCRKVNDRWPFRWLVADDVGLGKTIECGLSLMPLVASGRVKRALILAPAKLVPQWRTRLKDMFDLRFQQYVSAADNPRGDFWATADKVVASLQTLRDDRRGARARLLDAEPWDVVVVDEAHHLSADEHSGETLAYSLVSELERRRKIVSLLLFTGTPHRGKDHAFLALMNLVRPDLFDPDEPLGGQLGRLPEAMIRNNKATATDLRGRRLFTPVSVTTSEYAYTPAERAFYDTLSAFILDGRAYADTLTGRGQTARILLLVTLQKLAASSIEAIASALRRRRDMLRRTLAAGNAGGAPPPPAASAAATSAELDERADAEEALAERTALLLLGDEVSRIDDLLALADAVGRETKISRIIELIDAEMPTGEPILLFTEYKATQALVVNALQERFGRGCCAFINGDERLDGVLDARGSPSSVSEPRERAAERFNAGDVRFLVSTEAGGEGIDLQERCSTLVHVDLPWNPMRLHQRVGRLSRYGQTRPVRVHIIRNPVTVEARIWDLLNAKLERIQQTISSVMDEPEDIGVLVVGMSPAGLFDELFSQGLRAPRENLASWFDQASATLGGRDVVDTAREILGNVARFDFQTVGRDMPRLDLPDLEPFLANTLSRHGRRLLRREEGLDLKTPEPWAGRDYAVRERYDGLVLDRRARVPASRVLGIGHVLMDVALADAVEAGARVGVVARLEAPLVLAAVADEVTGAGLLARRLLVGASRRDGVWDVVPDWRVLEMLNACGGPRDRGAATAVDGPAVQEILAEALAHLAPALPSIAAEFRRPKLFAEMLLLPEEPAPQRIT